MLYYFYIFMAITLDLLTYIVRDNIENYAGGGDL